MDCFILPHRATTQKRLSEDTYDENLNDSIFMCVWVRGGEELEGQRGEYYK